VVIFSIFLKRKIHPRIFIDGEPALIVMLNHLDARVAGELLDESVRHTVGEELRYRGGAG